MTHQASTQAQQQTTQSRAAWDMIADGYDRHVTPTHQPLAQEAIARLNLRPGSRFLDVASGSGALGLAAARLGAQVIATDISPRMISHLNTKARAERLPNLNGQVMDGHHLEFENDSFDCSGSQFGVMLFPDLPRGLSEMARITKPGGQVLMVTFGPPSKVEFLGFFLTAVKHVVPDFAGLPMSPPPLPFQVSDPAKLERAMVSAGLTAVQIETTIETLAFESAAQLWRWLANSNPIGTKLVGSLSQDQQVSVRSLLDEMLRERANGHGPARLTNPINIAIGTV